MDDQKTEVPPSDQIGTTDPSVSPTTQADSVPDTTTPAAEAQTSGAVSQEGTIKESQPAVREVAFSWQASEYIHHHKGLAWYAGLTGILVVLLAVAIITKQWLSIAVFAVMGAAIAVYANKPPRVLTYELDQTSVAIEGKVYPYKTFRSFSVMRDAEWHSIDLEPTQRFMPRMTLLFADEDYDTIVSHLDLHLPQIDRKPDVIERLSRYLRF